MTPEETAILTAFLTNHGIVDYIFPVGSENRTENIQTYLDTVPNILDSDDLNPFTGLKQVLHCLTFPEKVTIFNYQNASDWFRDILSKVSTGVITDNATKNYIDTFSQVTTNSKLLSVSFNEFLVTMVRTQNNDLLDKVFHILIMQQAVSLSSSDKMKIELLQDTSLKRWQRLQLSTLPTLAEINAIIS